MNNKTDEIELIDEDSQFLIDQLYLSTPTTMMMPDGQTVEVLDTGNIALMAYGYKGIIAWRKRREKVFRERIYSPYLEGLKNNRKQKEAKETEEENGQ